MKKIIFLLAIITASGMETKAQPELSGIEVAALNPIPQALQENKQT